MDRDSTSLNVLGWVLGLIWICAGCGDRVTVDETRRGKSLAYAQADATAEKEGFADVVGHECKAVKEGADLLGETTLVVSSKDSWTFSGLYVEAGDHIEVSAQGLWTIWKDRTSPFGPDGHPALSMLEGCRKGSLVAKIGLGVNAKPICVGANKAWTASDAGILYFAMNDNASTSYHDGELSVTLRSEGNRVPHVAFDQAETYAYCDVASGWVEIASQKHVLLTVPVELADLYRHKIPATLEFFDSAYDYMRELNGGGVPFGGERIRFFPDFGLHAEGWIKTGNPVLLDPRHLNAVYPSEFALLATGDPAYPSFDFLRTLGIAFSRYRGQQYQVDAQSAQAFGDHFALYAMEKLDRHDLPLNPCSDREAHVSQGSFQTFLSDSWLQLCLLTQIQEQVGWSVFTRFWSELPLRDQWSQVLPPGASALEKWNFIAARLGVVQPVSVEVMAQVRPSDLAPIFTSFHIPLE